MTGKKKLHITDDHFTLYFSINHLHAHNTILLLYCNGSSANNHPDNHV
jgi:hypothetical protein